MKISVIGLGKMGAVLAKKLLNPQFELTVFNRTQEKMQALIEVGAKGANTLQDAVKNADVIITCLLDDNAVLQTANEFIDFMPENAIHIGTSTILPDTSKKLFELHEQKNQIYIAGNVLGVPKVAEEGALTSIVAGNAEAIQKCDAIFKSYSSNIINVGAYPFQANVFKICANYFLATTIEAIGELYVFAEKSNVDLGIIQKFFHTVFAHPAYKRYIDKIKERDFDDVNFDLKGGMKDLDLFQKAFSQVGVVPGIANIIKDKFIIALAHQLDGKDWSAVTEVTRLQANI